VGAGDTPSKLGVCSWGSGVSCGGCQRLWLGPPRKPSPDAVCSRAAAHKAASSMDMLEVSTNHQKAAAGFKQYVERRKPTLQAGPKGRGRPRFKTPPSVPWQPPARGFSVSQQPGQAMQVGDCLGCIIERLRSRKQFVHRLVSSVVTVRRTHSSCLGVRGQQPCRAQEWDVESARQVQRLQPFRGSGSQIRRLVPQSQHTASLGTQLATASLTLSLMRTPNQARSNITTGNFGAG